MACSMTQLEEKFVFLVVVVVLYITLQHCTFQYSWAILGEAEVRKNEIRQVQRKYHCVILKKK